MECSCTYFVLANIPHDGNPNNPDEDAHHHAFLVEKDEFDRAMEILRVRGIRLVKYSDENHRSFPGRHAYFHDADGNCIEICYLYEDGEKYVGRLLPEATRPPVALPVRRSKRPPDLVPSAPLRHSDNVRI